MVELLVRKLETILVVDDTDFVREIVVAILKYASFVVLQANSGPNALKLAAHYAQGIDLLLTEVKMAEMSGPYLAEILKQSRPDIHVMLIGGDVLVFDYGWAFIQKPFKPVELLGMINAVLHKADSRGRFVSHKAAGSE
jgi:DNA-binding response OmpR family regulator